MIKISVLLISAALVGAAFAQPAPPAIEGESPIREKLLKNMKPELRERFEAARKRALEDPGVRAAREKATLAMEDVREQTRAAMLKVDPELKAEIEKAFPKAKFGEGRAKAPGFSGLEPDDRAEVLAAREVAKQTPKVRAAQARLNQASTPEERQSATKAYRDAMAAAVREKQPDLAAALEPPPDANVMMDAGAMDAR